MYEGRRLYSLSPLHTCVHEKARRRARREKKITIYFGRRTERDPMSTIFKWVYNPRWESLLRQRPPISRLALFFSLLRLAVYARASITRSTIHEKIMKYLPPLLLSNLTAYTIVDYRTRMRLKFFSSRAIIWLRNSRGNFNNSFLMTGYYFPSIEWFEEGNHFSMASIRYDISKSCGGQ